MKGWQYLDQHWYLFGDDGLRKTGWQWMNRKWYYFDEEGIMQSGQWIDGVYYVKEDGDMAVSEWVKGKEKTACPPKNAEKQVDAELDT